MKNIKISIGSDHGGKELRDAIVKWIEQEGYSVIDHGVKTLDSVDYPDYGFLVGDDVAAGRADFGIVCCTTGIGISISANKVKGVRAATVFNMDGAEFSRRHNDANVIAFGQKYITPYLACQFIDKFIHTPFDGGRHENRVRKIQEKEKF